MELGVDVLQSELTSIVINPFWAATEEQRELLTVKDSPLQASEPTGKKLAPSASRRRLVKQKKYCQSVEDVTLGVPEVEVASTSIRTPTPSAGVTINVTASSAGVWSAASEEGASSHHHLRPCVSIVPPQASSRSNVTSGSSRGSRTPRQQSLESRMTVTLPQGPIEDGAPLPSVFEPVPNNIYGKPLQEIDPTVRDKVSSLSYTFCSLTARFYLHFIVIYVIIRYCVASIIKQDRFMYYLCSIASYSILQRLLYE